MAYGRVEQQRAGGRASGFVVIAVLLATAIGNSFMFFQVIWPEFSPSDPFSAMLFFVSAAAHLIYLFIPWFLIDMFARSAGSGGFFLRLCTLVGALSCVLVLSLSVLKDVVAEPPTPVSITRANCAAAGGVASSADGRVTCEFARSTPAVSADDKPDATGDGRV